jgi:hypothetical protein
MNNAMAHMPLGTDLAHFSDTDRTTDKTVTELLFSPLTFG